MGLGCNAPAFLSPAIVACPAPPSVARRAFQRPADSCRPLLRRCPARRAGMNIQWSWTRTFLFWVAMVVLTVFMNNMIIAIFNSAYEK
jgi:hypothetical protein